MTDSINVNRIAYAVASSSEDGRGGENMMLGQINVSFMRAHRSAMTHQSTMAKAMQRLTTGKRINSAADDAAGLAISQKMRSNIISLNMQIRNAKDEINALYTAEGGMSETHAMLQRMKELTIQASNGTCTDQERALIDKEYQALMDGIDYVYKNTKFNDKTLLNEEDLYKIQGEAVPGDSKTLRDTNLLTLDGAKEANEMVTRVIDAVSYSRAGVGANINVLDHRISAMETAAINAEDSLSTIEDADMAQEMMNYTKASILLQVSQAMMAHCMNDAKNIVTMLSAM